MMSKQKVSREIPVDVIETDHRLEAQKKTASFALDKHRWEQCADPRGPQHTQDAYADAIGRTQSVIARSVKAWAIALKRQNSIDSRTRINQSSEDGRRQSSDVVEDVSAAIQAGQEIEDPTQEIHAESKQISEHGEEKATLYAALAAAFGVAPSSIRNRNWAHWRSRAIELLAEYASEMSISDATAKAVRDVVTEKRHHDNMAAEAARQAAEEAARPTSFMEAANVLIEGSLLMERRIKGLRGDLESRLANLDDDQRGIIESELARIKAITDRFAFVLIVSGS
jgi:hypothetical protein